MRPYLITLMLVGMLPGWGVDGVGAATSSCRYLGTSAPASWRTTATCPAGTLGYVDWADPSKQYCVVYRNRTVINQHGFGACGEISNRITDECFDADVCHSLGGTCQEVQAYADLHYFDGNAYDCNNMQGAVTGGGVWFDRDFGGTWHIIQQNGEKIFSGTLDTNTALDVNTRCGVWNVSGSIDGNGGTNIHLTNPTVNPPPRCQRWFDYSGLTDQRQSVGRYHNAKDKRGAMAFFRSTAPYGYSGTELVQQAPSSQVPPWADLTPGPVPTVPGAPVLKTPTISGNGYVYLEWLVGHDTDTTNVYVARVASGPYTLSGALNNGSSIKVTGLPNWTTCYFVAVGVNPQGQSSYSNVVSRAPMPAPQVFGVTALAPSWGAVTLTWGTSAYAGAYDVYVWTGTAWRQYYANLSSSVHAATVNGLVNGSKYVFFVRGVNGNGEFADTPLVAATPHQ